MTRQAIVIHGPKDLRLETRERAPVPSGQVRVVIEAGGICGSDLHYYNHGGFGTVRLREPMVLGHEVAGRIAEVGSGVSGLSVGQRVTVNPSVACGTCSYCREGLGNHCLDMRFYGSAMRFPHVQGAFRRDLVALASQCVPLPEAVPAAIATLTEPFSVALHAARRAGELAGKRVLVMGCGPIGQLCIVAAKRAGAGEIIAVDIIREAMELAGASGADRLLHARDDADAIRGFAVNKGTIDVVFEASGNAAALASGLDALRPRGTAVLVGLGGDATLAINTIVAKEIAMIGAFRFHEEFVEAARLIAAGDVDLSHLVTHRFPAAAAVEAFETAGDRSKAMKVQLLFE